MVIRVFRDATVVANAVTAASAAAPESVTVADAVTATCAASGRDVPPVAVMVTVPPDAGMYTVYCREPAFAPDDELALADVLIDVRVKLSEVVVLPANESAEAVVIPPVAKRFAKVPAAISFPALSNGVT